MTVGEVVAKLKLDLTEFRSGLQRAGSLLEKHREAAMKVGAAFAGWGAALSGALALATREASEMQSAMTELNKVLQLSEGALEGVQEKLHALARETGIADEALAGALANIAKVGLSGAAGEEVLRAATRAAVAGKADVQSVGDTLVTILRAYNLNASEAAKVTDTLYQASLKGRMSFGETVSAIKGLVPVASQLGVGYDQLAAALSTMTTVGYDAENSLMGLNMVMVRLTNPSAQLKTALQAAGYASGQALVETRGLAGAIEFITKAAGDDEQAMIQMAGGARAFKAVAALAANDSQLFKDKLADLAEAAGSVDSAFAKTAGTFAMQWSRFIVTVKQDAEAFGSVLLPVLTAAGKALAALASLVQGVPGPLRVLMVAGAALGAAVFSLAGAWVLFGNQTKATIGLLGKLALALAGVRAEVIANQVAMARGLGGALSAGALTAMPARSATMATGTLVTLAGQLVRPGDFSLLKQTSEGLVLVTGAAARAGVAFRVAGAAVKGFFASIGPVGWIVIGITAAAEAWLLYKDHVEKAAQAQREQAERAKEQAERLKELVAQLKAVDAELAKHPNNRDLLEQRQHLINQAVLVTPGLPETAPIGPQGYALATVGGPPPAQAIASTALHNANMAYVDAMLAQEKAAAAVASYQAHINDISESIRKQFAGQQVTQEQIDAITVNERKELARLIGVAEDAYAAVVKARKAREEAFRAAHSAPPTTAAVAPSELDAMRKLGAEMRKLGADAMVVEHFLHVRWGASAAKATKEVRQAWAALAEARGASYEAALRTAEATYDEEWKAAAGSADKQKAAKVKLLAALIAAEREHSKQIQEEIKRRDAAYAEQTRSRVSQWLADAKEMHDAGRMSAGQYIETLQRVISFLREYQQARLRAGKADQEMARLQVEAERAAFSEMKSLQDGLRESQKKLHDERLQWAKEEQQEQTRLYRSQLDLIALLHSYETDMLAVRGAATPEASAKIDRSYLDQLAAAKPLEGLPPEVQARLRQIELMIADLRIPAEAAKALIEEKQALQQQAVTPTPEQRSQWAEAYREAIRTALEEAAITPAEAERRLTEARDEAVKAANAAAAQEKAIFAERRSQHEEMMRNLQAEEKSLQGYLRRATGAFREIIAGLANASETILNQVRLASSQLHPFAVSAAGWGRVTTESGGPRVTNFYYQGQRVAPSPKIRDLMDQIANELERERQHPRD
ncbi:MAG: phage tail tape measure protein [Armatimonadota bacterium]